MPVVLAAAVLLAALTLTGCQNTAPVVTDPPAGETLAHGTAPVETTPVETEPTEPTEPAPTAPPDGNPDDVTCQGSYTVADNDAVLAAHKVVATIGDEKLTNAHLQIYYWLAVSSYREAGNEIAPDFSQPLDTQMCELEDGAITWQQYFLQQALNSWHNYYSMGTLSETYEFATEEAYDRDEKKHAENLRTEIYNLDLLYGYNTDYEIADAHQEFLDNLPSLMKELAAENGYETLSAMVQDLAGIGTSSDYLLKYAELANEGYMFATSLSYYIEPTEEEVEAYFTENEDAYADAGITRDGGSYVEIRQILVVPENAEVAEDGTVTASQSDWDACLTAAKKLMTQWEKNPTEANFSEMAFANSADTGSSVAGGQYTGIYKGQLTQELDEWCFDEARQTGDTTIIQTDCGYHIVYFCDTTDIWFDQAEKDLIADLLAQQIHAAAEEYPMTVDYSAIHLGLADAEADTITISDLLYPDVAHERFPVAPLYFQQDYPDTMYGNYSLRTYGCGVTTMSMLVSYMTDNEWTPPEMCALYGKYCSKAGTAHAMFTEVPTDQNFYCVKRVYNWSEALEALEEGYMVVTLQRDGYWTNGGHYLLLHNLIETEDGTKIQVRDSNLYNYKKLEGHTTGYFDLSTIPNNSRSYWIYQKKVTRIDTCVRCGEPTEESHVPYAMFAEDYYCPKCQTAMNRRNGYMNACLGII